MPEAGSETKQSSADKWWAVVGKIGAGLGTLLAAIALYHNVLPDEPKVIAQCQVSEFDGNVVFADLGRQIEDARADAQKCQDAVQRQTPPTLPVVPGVTAPAAPATSDVSIGARLRDVSSELSRDVGVAQCTLINSGSKDAKAVQIRFPFKLRGATVDADKLSSDQIGKNSLSLGDVHPGESRKITVWASELFLATQPVSVVYADGNGQVQLARPFYGRAASIASFFEEMANHPIIWALEFSPLPVFLIVVLIEQNRRRRKTRAA